MRNKSLAKPCLAFGALLTWCLLSISGCAPNAEVRETMVIDWRNENGQQEITTISDAGSRRSRTSVVTVPDSLEAVPTRTRLIHQIDGVFIGLEASKPSANTQPVSSPALGAALAFSLFAQTKDRSPAHAPPGEDGGAISHLELHADLRPEPGDSAPKQSQSHPRDEEPLTKQRVLAAARAQVARVSAGSQEEPATAIFYLASRGTIDAGGMRYAMLADSLENDLATWVSYAEIINIFAELSSPETPVTALVIFDMYTELKETTPEALSPPEQVVVVSASSAGSYAYHLARPDERDLLEALLDSQRIPAQSLEPDSQGRERVISALPVAIAASLHEFEQEAESEICVGQRPEKFYGVTSVQLVDAIKAHTTRLILHPEGGAKQTVNVLSAPQTRTRITHVEDGNDFRLFGIPCSKGAPRPPQASNPNH